MNEQSELPQNDPDQITRPSILAEQERSKDIRKNTIDAASNFARYLTYRYPQVDLNTDSSQSKPQLNYYIAGSLATTLLSRADRVDLCEETKGSDITLGRSLEVSEQTRTLLAQFARPIGDIDYVPTTHYKALRQAVQDSYSTVSREEYSRSREKYLWKGGGGPKFGEVPDNARDTLKRRDDQEDDYGIMCDPLETYGTKKFAKMTIDSKDYYITRPDTMVGYKILHMLQSYELNPDKFNNDFGTLYKAISQLYTEEELTQATHQLLKEYDDAMGEMQTAFSSSNQSSLSKMIRKLLQREDLSQDSRAFIGTVVDYDQDHGKILG